MSRQLAIEFWSEYQADGEWVVYGQLVNMPDTCINVRWAKEAIDGLGEKQLWQQSCSNLTSGLLEYQLSFER